VNGAFIFMAISQTHTSSFDLPDTLGLIVLEECFHFPGCFLPLYIFEQRYRQMLDHALETSRMFGVGTIVNDELMPVITVGLIRASKKREDGTSHVMLYGVKRIRITGGVQERPFRIATIEPFPTLRESTDEELLELKHRALDLLPPAKPECSEAMQTLRSTLDEMVCPDLACDILSYHFVREPEIMSRLMVEPSLEKRYAVLMHELERLKEGA
jgi:ATP-dependent Lon protease